MICNMNAELFRRRYRALMELAVEGIGCGNSVEDFIRWKAKASFCVAGCEVGEPPGLTYSQACDLLARYAVALQDRQCCGDEMQPAYMAALKACTDAMGVKPSKGYCECPFGAAGEHSLSCPHRGESK